MRVLMISNMYPSKKYPSYGVFVKNFEDSLKEENIILDKIVLKKSSNFLMKLIRYIFYYIKILITLFIVDYDIVYVHYVSHNAIPLLILSKVKKMNLWINIHGSDILPYKKTQIILQKYVNQLIPTVDRIIVPSKYYMDLVIDRFKIDSNKVQIIASGGVNNNIFNKYNLDIIENFKLKNNITEKDKVIGFVSRLEGKKGWDTFLRAIARLNEINFLKNYKILIVGDGSDLEVFNLLVDELGIRHKIIHKGLMKQNELALVYNSLDVLCFTSYQESLGLVPIECMACGTIVIASDIPATKEYIIHGDSGVLFETGNYIDLSNKIIEFFELEVNKLDSMSKKSMQVALKYSKENVSNQIKKVFKDYEIQIDI